MSVGRQPHPRIAWYPKTLSTFADTLALVRLIFWIGISPLARFLLHPDMQKSLPRDPVRCREFLCHHG